MRNIILIAAFAGMVVACGGKQSTDEPTSQPVEVEESATASVRFVHASEASPIRVFAGDTELTTVPVQPTGWGDRIEAPEGPHTLAFKPSGGGEAFATADVVLEGDTSYTVIFAGDETSSIRAEMPTAFVLEDGTTAPDAGMGRARFFHAVPTAAAVTLSDGSGRGYAAGLEYGSGSPWYDVDPASQTVNIAVGGEQIASVQAPFTDGMLTTVVIHPEGGGVGVSFINETTE